MSATPRYEVSRFLAQRPAILAWLLQVRTGAQRLCGQSRPIHWVAIVAIAVAHIWSLAVGAELATVRQTLVWLDNHPFQVGLTSALFAMLAIPRRRAVLAAEHQRWWLGPTPRSRRHGRQLAAMRITLSSLLMWLSVVIGVLIACALGRLAAGTIVSALTIGALLGGAIGSVWPLSTATPRRENSRYVLRTQAVDHDRPSLDGLSRWPIAQALAWHRPENSRWLFIAAALSVPMGASALLSLTILVGWSLSSYLLALVRSVPHVAKEAALWLRPTGLPFGRFTWALLRRAFAHQCIGAALFAVMLVAMGAPVTDVLYAIAVWLTLVCTLGLVGTQQAFRGRSSTVRAALCVLVMMLAEGTARGFGIALSALIALGHLRGVTHARS